MEVPASTSQTILSPIYRESMSASRFFSPDDIFCMATVTFFNTELYMRLILFVKDLFVAVYPEIMIRFF